MIFRATIVILKPNDVKIEVASQAAPPLSTQFTKKLRDTIQQNRSNTTEQRSHCPLHCLITAENRQCSLCPCASGQTSEPWRLGLASACFVTLVGVLSVHTERALETDQVSIPLCGSCPPLGRTGRTGLRRPVLAGFALGKKSPMLVHVPCEA